MPASHFQEQSEYLTILSQAPAEAVKEFTDTLLPELGAIEVLQNRTGLVMLSFTDTARGTVFHMGEVLIAEGRVHLEKQEGYGACLGRDLQQALALAILDAALQAGMKTQTILEFVEAEARRQHDQQQQMMCAVEATRVQMETF